MNIAKNFARNYEKTSLKNNTWNIRRLVDESFVPATQRIILKIVGFMIAYHIFTHLNFPK